MAELSTDSTSVPYPRGLPFSYRQLREIRTNAEPGYKEDIYLGDQDCWNAMRQRVDEPTLKGLEAKRDTAIRKAADDMNTKYLEAKQVSTTTLPGRPDSKSNASQFSLGALSAKTSKVNDLASLAWFKSLCSSSSRRQACPQYSGHSSPPNSLRGQPSTRPSTGTIQNCSTSSPNVQRSLADLL